MQNEYYLNNLDLMRTIPNNNILKKDSLFEWFWLASMYFRNGI